LSASIVTRKAISRPSARLEAVEKRVRDPGRKSVQKMVPQWLLSKYKKLRHGVMILTIQAMEPA